MRYVPPLALIGWCVLAAGPGAAEDISGRPSSLRRPIRSLIQPADITVEFRLPEPADEMAVQAVGKAVARAFEKCGTMVGWGPSAGQGLFVWLDRPPADWASLDAAVATILPGAVRHSVKLTMCLPTGRDGRVLARVRRSVLAVDGLQRAKVGFAEGAMTAEFRSPQAPASSLLWRLRAAALRAGRGPAGGPGSARSRCTS